MATEVVCKLVVFAGDVGHDEFHLACLSPSGGEAEETRQRLGGTVDDRNPA